MHEIGELEGGGIINGDLTHSTLQGISAMIEAPVNSSEEEGRQEEEKGKHDRKEEGGGERGPGGEKGGKMKEMIRMNLQMRREEENRERL